MSKRTTTSVGPARLLMFLSLSLAACGEARAPAPQAPAARPSAAASDLFGEWQVAALETPLLSPEQGRFGDPSGIAVLIGARGIEASSQCVPFLFEHGRSEERVRIAEQRWPDPVCERGLLPYETVFGSVLAGAARVEQAGPDGVRLTGGAGSVVLRRPATRIVGNPFGHVPAAGADLLWGHFRIVDIAGVVPPPGQPIDVAIGRLWIEARSGCLPFRWRFVRSGTGWSMREDWPDPRCEQGRNEAEQALERVMPAVRGFEWIAPYRLRFTGSAGSVTMVRVRR